MLMQDLQTHEYVAAKFIQRGSKVSMRSIVRTFHAGCTPCLMRGGRARLRVMTTSQINVNVERELLNHRPLLHAHIIRFREVRRCMWHPAANVHQGVDMNPDAGGFTDGGNAPRFGR